MNRRKMLAGAGAVAVASTLPVNALANVLKPDIASEVLDYMRYVMKTYLGAAALKGKGTEQDLIKQLCLSQLNEMMGIGKIDDFYVECKKVNNAVEETNLDVYIKETPDSKWRYFSGVCVCTGVSFSNVEGNFGTT